MTTALVIPNLGIRAAIEHKLVEMRAEKQGTIETIITCGGGMFAKTGLIKAGTELIGKIHLKEHINIMSFGDITVVTEEGMRRLTGFNIMACKAGSRRYGRVHEDTLWTTIIQTDETDIAKVEEMFFAKNYEELGNSHVC